MRRLLVVPAVLLGGAALPCTASAEIVKAPTGETSSLKVASSQTKTFKKHKLTFSATGAAQEVRQHADAAVLALALGLRDARG